MHIHIWNYYYFWLILGSKYFVEVSGFGVKEETYRDVDETSRNTLNIPMCQASLYVSVPYIVRLLAGGLATCMWKIDIIPGILMLCLRVFTLHCNKWDACTIITIIMMFNEASSQSSTGNAHDLSTVYGSNIISFVTTFGMTAAVLSTLMLSGLLQTNYAKRSWRITLFVNGLMYWRSGLSFILFGKGCLQYSHHGTAHVPHVGSIHFGEDI